MSGICSGTPALMARMAPASAPAEVVNHKLMVPEPGWFNSDRKTFEDWWRCHDLAKWLSQYLYFCHKLHSAISPPILQQFSWS